MNGERFGAFRQEILRRVKNAEDCKGEYGRAYASKSFAELMQVIKDNFSFACEKDVIEPGIMEEYREEFNGNGIWCNVSRNSGFLLVSDAEVEEVGGDTVVCMKGNSVVWNMRGSSVVRNMGGDSYAASYHAFECGMSENALLRIVPDNTVLHAGNLNFKVR